MNKYLKIVLIFFLCLIVLSAGFLFYLSRGLGDGIDLSINEIDLQNLEDGIYRGRYDGGRWSNELEIEIKNNQIVDVYIVEDLSFVLPEVRDDLFLQVMDQQSLDVDIISGSTVTSKAYLKAIENALAKLFF